MLPVDYWQHLDTLLSDSPEHASLMLQKSCQFHLPDVTRYLHLKQKAAKVDLARLLQIHVLTGLAFKVTNDNGQTQIFAQILQDVTVLSPVPPPDHIQWIVFPIPVTQGMNGRIIHVLMGHSSQGTGMIEARQMQQDSTDAARDARAAFALWNTFIHGTLILLPLLPDNSIPLTGRSLGLPCAIALHLLNNKKRWPAGLLATGDLAADGRIGNVSYLKEKQTAMRDIHCFIVPGSGFAHDFNGTIGCLTLKDALDAVDSFCLGTDPELINRYRHSLEDPKYFLDHFHELPLPFFELEKSKKYLCQISSQPHVYLEDAAKKLHSCSNDPLRARILTDVYTPEQLEAAVTIDPKLLRHIIYWCVGRLAYANHSGETSGADAWLELHDRLQTEMPAGELLESLNHLFIATRLNRYFFSPEVPRQIAVILEEETEGKAGCKANRHIGAMYGTLAQNCGFCGPDYFGKLDSYCIMAERAFSRVYADESRRLQAYRLYGLLDRMDMGRVSDLLNPYLDLPHSAGPPHWLATAIMQIASKNDADRYSALLALRAVADLVEFDGSPPAPFPAETITALQVPGLMQMHHPWQLIAFNIARLLISQNLPEKALALFEKSIEICRGGSETLQVMALLPYAELHKHTLAHRSHYEEANLVLKTIEESSYLNREHFSSLLGKSVTDALDYVTDNKKTFFPFSYR